ncbi:hypothetical protein ACFTAO_38545 [Paenibacillus rhizoplanae]
MKDTVNIGAGIVTIVLPFIVGYLVYRFNPPRGGRSWKSRFVFNKHMQRLRLLIRDSAAAAV